MNGRPFRVLVVVGLLAMATPFAVQRVNAQATNAGAGQSIVEQIDCDVTIVGADGKVTVISHGQVGAACQINDFVNMFVYLAKWGMSILAVLATLMFIYGGFSFITAGGRPSKVDEGKRVLTGTVIGTIISLTAYVIINTAVTAISGTTLASANPFGVVATVFGDNNPANSINGQTIRRAFSGAIPTGSGTNPGSEAAACRLDTSSWIRDCTDPLQVYCADSGTSGEGAITKLQTKLISLGCDCGTADGCYGKDTVACVRKFQIANDLPPSGVIDNATKSRIESGGQGCSGAQDAVLAKLPDTALAKTDGGDASGKCCVVNNGTIDLYCVNGISTRACQALGGDSNNYAGACGSGETAGRCGYCSNVQTPTPTLGACFMSVSSNWCQTTANNPSGPVYYFNNSCMGPCASCVNSLRASF